VKLRSVTRWVIGVPLLLLMIDFGLTNAEPVRLGLFPLGQFPFEIPLSVTILVAMGIGFFAGGLRVRIAELRHRRAARRAEEAVRLLEARHPEIRRGPPDTMLAHRA
jgi:uncharacterized integral membrane protein